MRTWFCYWFLFFSVSIFGQTPFECDGNIYVTNVVQNDNVRLLELLENRNDLQFVPFDATFPYNVNSIGYRRTDNLIYGINPTSHILYQIDATGNFEKIAVLNLSEDYYAGDVSPDGNELILFNGASIAKVDLNTFSSEAEYIPTTVIDTAQTIIACTDIAFHPQTGVLFGFDGVEGRLITIDPETGLIDNSSFEQIGYNNNIPALFFNPLGELKGIATDNTNQESILFQFDQSTGYAVRTNSLDVTGDRDACSCPFTLKVEASFRQKEAFPCTQMDYIVKVGNLGDRQFDNADLHIEFPFGFVVTEIVYNAFSGNLLAQSDDNLFLLQNMNIGEGVDSLICKISIPEDVEGFYHVQANLNAINTSTGASETYVSDEPHTFEKKDSSRIEILPLELGTLESHIERIELCPTDTAFIAFPYLEGLNYTWSTGDTTSYLETTEAGNYTIKISSFCDSIEYQTEVWKSDLTLDLGEDLLKQFNDDFSIEPQIESSSPIVSYQWTSDNNLPLLCAQCPTLPLRAKNSAHYYLEVTSVGGCSLRDTIFIEVNRPVYVPNVFSPNNDAINDFFYLQSVPPNIDILNFSIYERGGAKLFESSGTTNNPFMGWNGKFKGQTMQSGIYIWTAILEYPNGEQVQLEGDVLLMR